MQNPLIIQFDLHHRLFNNVLEGFSDAETNERLHGDTRINHVKYLAGHLLNSCFGLARLADLNPEIKWNDLFSVMGLSEAKDEVDYPSVEDILTEWNNLQEPLRLALTTITPEMLESKPPQPFDKVANSRNELWAFINHHIAYHIGQIGILRKAFGKGPMSYG